MNKILVSVLMIVSLLLMIIMFIDMAQDYDNIIDNVEFYAENNSTISEDLYVNRLINEIIEIKVNGVYQNIDDIVLSYNDLEDGSITLKADSTDVDDKIYVRYSYIQEQPEYIDNFIQATPVILLIIIVGGIGYVILKR